jgi:hypothetical protein
MASLYDMLFGDGPATDEQMKQFDANYTDAKNWIVQLRRNLPGDPLVEQYASALDDIFYRWSTMTRGGNPETAKGILAELGALLSGLFKLEAETKKSGAYKNVPPDETVGDKAYDALIAGKHGVQEAAAAAGAAVDSAKSAIPWIGLGLLGVGITVLVIAVSRK